MKRTRKYRHISTTIGFLMVSAISYAAHDIDQWRSRTAQIAADTTLTDSMKVIRLSDLTYNYFYYYRTFDPQYIDEFLQQTERFVGNDHPSDLLSYIYSTAVIIARGEKAMRVQEKCEYHTQRCTNPIISAKSWEYMGRKYINKAAGLEYMSRALNALQGTTLYAAQASVNRFIALYYSVQGDTANEMKYALRSLDLALMSDDLREQINSWETLAEAHYFSKNYPEAIEAYNKAHDIYLRLLEIPEPNPDVSYRDDMHLMVNLVNLGSMHYNNGDLHTAARIITEALETANRINFVETQAYCNKELGNIYIALKQYTVAEAYLQCAAALLETDYIKTAESHYIDYEVKLALARLYNLTGDYPKSAGYYHEGIGKYRDLHNEEQQAANRQYAATYETRMQEQSIARMETVVSYHERRRLLYAAILAVALIALYMVARLYRTRIALVQQKEETLRAQARLLKLGNRKKELDNQLKKQEADALLQQLAFGNHLREDRNRSFANITTFFERHPELSRYQDQVKNIIHQQSIVDNNVEQYKQGITDVPLEFYTALQQVAGNKLTPLDLKYCRLIYLETPTKDMAALLSVEPKTVRMAKYRLKQKFKLDKDEDLNTFIRSITNK